MMEKKMAFLEVKGLEKYFNDTQVLRGVDFTLEKGQVLSIIGSSGSGKTTLLRCLNFLETPDKGEIIINGQKVFSADDTSRMKSSELREKRLHFGLVFQSFNLFPQYTVFENLTLAPKMRAAETAKREKLSGEAKKSLYDKVDADAEALLSKVGLSQKRNSYPCELSGGQQQRVSIARALMQSPDILCFDEPTSALDPELTGEVLKVIRELRDSERTMIIVTHEMDFARKVSDKIMFMSEGIAAAYGTPEELFSGNGNERLSSFINAFDK